MDFSGYRTGGFKAVILDYGRVLSREPSTRQIARMTRGLHATTKDLERAYDRWRPPYDRGALSARVYWAKVARECGRSLTPPLTQLRRRTDLGMWGDVRPGMERWLRGLHRTGYRTALLSNMPGDMIRYVRRNSPWLAAIDEQVLSAEVRRIKPGRAIFRVCLDRLGVRAPECLFVDDTEANLSTARALGLVGVRFRSVAQLRSDLRSVGFRPVP